ncbi:MAG TPA: hypothetical protein VJR70_07405 [Stellaceae bacterium]|nr:hypothetical protein [Stellaceae bacterium]
MTRIGRIIGAALAALVIEAGMVASALAQGAPPAGAQADSGGGPPAGYMGEGQGAAGPSGATRALDMPILYVTGIEVIRTAMEPKVDLVRVTGLTSSAGWSSPQLVPFFYGKPADDVLDLQFIATSPEQSQKADGFVPVTAMFTLEGGGPYKGVRVRAGANALELKQIPGTTHATVKAIDCKDCIGKKFAEKGKAQAGAAGTVREEDLPRGFRVIVPTHGVAGIVHNPNRLDLILDDNQRIVMAFWE